MGAADRANAPNGDDGDTDSDEPRKNSHFHIGTVQRKFSGASSGFQFTFPFLYFAWRKAAFIFNSAFIAA
jgi:hypothetical protein